jgi:2-hydroxy-3-keto-5-methylthiopentenyl-1-phosphate phosphatase
MKVNAVLLDFDGTITTINVLDSLYEEFGGPSYRHYMERWGRGEISTMEEIEQIFNTVKATRQEMEAFLRTVELDPGFKSLFGFCREWDYPFAIVSDGLRWYIDYILDFHEVRGVVVHASKISFTGEGFRFEYPWYDPSYPLRSTAKPLIVDDYQKRGYHVIFVGDGLGDVEAAEVADVVYAKDVLLREARARGIDVLEFENLHDVYRDL